MQTPSDGSPWPSGPQHCPRAVRAYSPTKSQLWLHLASGKFGGMRRPASYSFNWCHTRPRRGKLFGRVLARGPWRASAGQLHQKRRLVRGSGRRPMGAFCGRLAGGVKINLVLVSPAVECNARTAGAFYWAAVELDTDHCGRTELGDLSLLFLSVLHTYTDTTQAFDTRGSCNGRHVCVLP